MNDPVAGITPRPELEVVVPDLNATGRWFEHDYPTPLARWHLHPEAEIHLITDSRGVALIGDYVGPFTPGHLVLVGAHLPHNWISDLPAGERIQGRDLLLQIDPQAIDVLAQTAPELREAGQLLKRASRGIEFFDETARAAAHALESIRGRQGLARFEAVMSLLRILATAPASEQRLLASHGTATSASQQDYERIDTVFAYITRHLEGDISLEATAELVGMTPTSFSRFFRAAAGRTFSDTVRRLRIVRACQLLAEDSSPVIDVALRVGYRNLSNFNRQFRAETGTTPSLYRRAATVASTR